VNEACAWVPELYSCGCVDGNWVAVSCMNRVGCDVVAVLIKETRVLLSSSLWRGKCAARVNLN
jgi:hypothetical protein